MYGGQVYQNAWLRQVKESIDYYMENARIIAETLTELGVWFTGDQNSPYIWLKCPGNRSSWEFFDQLLQKCGIVGTPGMGFGNNGEGFFRFTAFGSREYVLKAMKRIRSDWPW